MRQPLGTFFINRNRVEIAYLDKAVRPHRMGHRPPSSENLHPAQHAHIFDATHRATAVRPIHVGGEFLVAEPRESLPFTTTETSHGRSRRVTGPVMKVFMADHASILA